MMKGNGSMGTVEERITTYLNESGITCREVGEIFNRTKQAISAKLRRRGSMTEREMLDYGDALGLEIHISIREKDSQKEY